jgi:hypothetical protein
MFMGCLCVVTAIAQTCPNNVPHLQGTWRTLPYLMPINPISATLLHNGKVLIVAGSENDSNNNSPGAESYRNAIWDPTGTTSGSVTVQSISYDVFCSGTVALPDGRSMIVGGTSSYENDFSGDNRASIFDPATQQFMQTRSMVDGRWYATATALGDGRIAAFSGLSSSGGTNNTVEIYDLRNAGAGWTSPRAAPFAPPLYPHMFLLPSGKVFFTGSGVGDTANSWFLDPPSGTWTMSAPTTMDRSYGSSVLLSLLPPSYTPVVMNFGGGDPTSTSSTELIDLSSANPGWTPGPNMSTGRIQMNAIILPNGKVLAEGGSRNQESPDPAGKSADMYDPVTNTMNSAGAATYSRLYHSTALLLPDGRVVSMGSNPPPRGVYEPAIEIYTPPYLYDSNNQLIANRPQITGITPKLMGYNAPFSVTYTSASPISSAVLMRPGSSTHAFDMDQRLIGLCGAAPQPTCGGSGTLSLTSPPNGNIAPPGYYMLFLLDSSGVPSVAQFIQLTPYTTAPPSGSITAPGSDTSVTAGASVMFTGSSPTAAMYSWIFPGGSPGTSTAQNPGNVSFADAGTYTTSLTAIDSSGNTDPSPPTRTVSVLPSSPDFSIAVTPSSVTISPGQSATFTVTTQALTGFNGNVSLSVSSESGFPNGITSGGFSPASITGAGSSTLTINTSTSAVPIALSLTVTGTSGVLKHTASTTLLVNLAAPAGLAATSTGSGQVSLSWSAVSGATGYHLKRALVSGGPYTTVGCLISTTYNDSGLANGTTYYYVVSAGYTAGPNAGGESADSTEVSVTPLGGGGGGSAIRVNAGGESFTDGAGNVWSADTGFNGGGAYATSTAVTDTANPSQAPMYQSQRFGNFTYQFAVPSGTYTVNLKFAEVWWTSSGQRVFDVLINGQTVLSRFDIVAAAGGAFTAIDKSFTVGPVTQITIQFVTDIDNADINAIEIVSGSSPVAVSVSPPDATLGAGQSQSFAATVSNTSNTGVTWALNPASGAGTISVSGNTATYTAPATVMANQTVTLTATSVADTTKSASAQISLAPGGSFTPIRVNAGGEAFTDPATGNVWSADTGFTGGGAYATSTSITDTANPSQAPLYPSQRFGNFMYQFAVPSGTYTVNLKFAEVWWTSPGQRVFDVLINGQTVLSRFDIVASAGAAFTAIDKSFTVGSVTQITIQFVTDVDNADINAIEIVSGGSAGNFTPIRLNAGGGSFTDPANGNLWTADTGFNGGDAFATSTAITDTAHPSQAPLYQSQRFGNFTYQFAVPNGNYTVNLKFAEVWWTSPGQRVFEVLINGQTVLSRFDIVAAAGGAFTAVDKSFTVGPVTQITIQFITDLDNADINAIEIVAGSSP